MVGRDVEKMLAVGLVWGATNALMRRGTVIWDQALKSTPQANTPLLKKWLKLLFIWQYTLPFLINLSASATFFAILSDSPISVAVPVTNATTFAATAVFGIILGEETRIGLALFGGVLLHGRSTVLPVLTNVIYLGYPFLSTTEGFMAMFSLMEFCVDLNHGN